MSMSHIQEVTFMRRVTIEILSRRNAIPKTYNLFTGHLISLLTDEELEEFEQRLIIYRLKL